MVILQRKKLECIENESDIATRFYGMLAEMWKMFCNMKRGIEILSTFLIKSRMGKNLLPTGNCCYLRNLERKG
jgi:hypothetical protein